MKPIALALPFTGRWLTQNSPARRVPSHGIDVLGLRYAIDFVGVNDRRRTGDPVDWRTLLATEPPDRFYGFGRPILAPCDGVVVATHDGEPDHEARRSQLALVGYLLGQRKRYEQGYTALAGNHIIIETADAAYVAVVHLRQGSIRTTVGDVLATGRHIADCGNSGNSTQPHVHLQAMDHPDPNSATGIPIVFRTFREWPRGSDSIEREFAVPAEGSVVEPV